MVKPPLAPLSRYQTTLNPLTTLLSPRWESSQEGAELMLKYGLEYDHSFSHHDCQCYWLRTGDKWIPIDYEKHPDHWMKPLEAGVTTGLCEIPASWYADDLPPMMFIVRLSNVFRPCSQINPIQFKSWRKLKEMRLKTARRSGFGLVIGRTDIVLFVSYRKKHPTATAG